MNDGETLKTAGAMNRIIFRAYSSIVIPIVIIVLRFRSCNVVSASYYECHVTNIAQKETSCKINHIFHVTHDRDRPIATVCHSVINIGINKKDSPFSLMKSFAIISH